MEKNLTEGPTCQGGLLPVATRCSTEPVHRRHTRSLTVRRRTPPWWIRMLSRLLYSPSPIALSLLPAPSLSLCSRRHGRTLPHAHRQITIVKGHPEQIEDDHQLLFVVVYLPIQGIEEGRRESTVPLVLSRLQPTNGRHTSSTCSPPSSLPILP